MTSKWIAGVAAASFLLAAPPAFAADSAEPDAGAAQHRKLIEQKLRLVEMLVTAQTTRNADPRGGADNVNALERRQQLLDQARQAIASGDLTQAGRALDDALVRQSRTAARASTDGSGLGVIAQRARFKNLSEQLASYRGTLQSLAGDARQRTDAQALLVRTDALVQEAGTASTTGDIDGATLKLATAYRMVVEGLARIQAGQTITHSLQFDSPEQEYAYELRRFQSHQMLLKIAVDEAPPAGEKQKVVDAFAAESQRLRDEAGELARRGNHQPAVGVMEKAATQLIRALQTMGVPVF